MERHAEEIADLYEFHDRPSAGDTLEEAVWIEEQSLGYPLNLMCTLYYESTFCEPFHNPEENSPSNPEDRDE